MSPLSAIRPFIAPELRAVPLPTPGVESPATKPIPFSELQDLPPAVALQPAAAPSETQGSFSSLLGRFVSDVTDKQTAAGDAVNGLLRGQNVSLHQAMIAMEEASVSFQLMVEVRNKLLESYQELMRMQI